MTNLLSVSSVFSTIFSILLALVVLLIMISIHELGHYIAGKVFKFKINEFAIGMGPAIFKKKHKNSDEVFSIRVLPLGGYCAFEGEDEDSEIEGSFNSKPAWQRIIVLIAGAFMNLILGIIVLTLSIGIYGQLSIKTYDIKPINDSEFVGYSLQNDDIILEIEGKNTFMSTDIIDALQGKEKGDVVNVKVQSNGKVIDRKVRLRNAVNSQNLTDNFSAFTALGISTIEKIEGGEFNGCYLLRVKDKETYEDSRRIYYASDLISYAKTLNVGETLTFYYSKSGSDRFEQAVEITKDFSTLSDSEILLELGINKTKTLLKYVTENVKFSFFETIERGLQYSVSVGGTIFKTLGQLLTGKLGINAMGGTITTIGVTAEAIKVGGFNYFLEMLGFIGINLAVFNLLPIPALDGSRVVFATIEWIRKKPVNRKVEGVIHAIGLILLLGFSILVDVLQLIK
ncbi:MAG: RIP metalloprotease RseP [Clostridiales bacterium]|nr:RIP metalloprotease RseP [Clostridiales bacterium]